jgi:hypothetical protein
MENSTMKFTHTRLRKTYEFDVPEMGNCSIKQGSFRRIGEARRGSLAILDDYENPLG